MKVGDPEPLVEVDPDLVEYVVVGLPEAESLERIATALAALGDASAIRILDAVVLTKADDGSTEVLEVGDVESLSPLTQTEGWYGGLLSTHDVALVSATLAAQTAAVLLLAEDRWAAPLARAARSAGGRLLGGERIPRSRIHASLAGVETRPAGNNDSDDDGEEAAGAEQDTVS